MQVRELYLAVTLSSSNDEYLFPYNQVNKKDNPFLVHISQNLGHDIIKIPAFSSDVVELPWEYTEDYLEVKDTNYFEIYHQIVIAQLPFLYPGVVWLFESFEQMAENSYPQKKEQIFQK